MVYRRGTRGTERSKLVEPEKVARGSFATSAPISRAAILFAAVPEFIIAGLQACPGAVAGEAADSGAINAQATIALGENDPAIFHSEMAGILGR